MLESVKEKLQTIIALVKKKYKTITLIPFDSYPSNCVNLLFLATNGNTIPLWATKPSNYTSLIDIKYLNFHPFSRSLLISETFTGSPALEVES